MFGTKSIPRDDETATENARALIRSMVRKVGQLRGLKIPHAIEDVARALELSERKVRRIYRGEVARIGARDYLTLRGRYAQWLGQQINDLLQECESLANEQNALLGRNKCGSGLGSSGSTRGSLSSDTRYAGPERRLGADRRREARP